MHQSLTTGLLIGLGLTFSMAQTSFGISSHSVTSSRLGTFSVTVLQVLTGTKTHFSFGTDVTNFKFQKNRF